MLTVASFLLVLHYVWIFLVSLGVPAVSRVPIVKWGIHPFYKVEVGVIVLYGCMCVFMRFYNPIILLTQLATC